MCESFPSKEALASMKLSDNQVRRYLDRIEYNTNGSELPPPTKRTLYLLVHLHYTSIPFENLDVFLKPDGVDISLGAIFNKICGSASVCHAQERKVGGRGGYCFEHNKLMAAVLLALGYKKVEAKGARVWNDDGEGNGKRPEGPPYLGHVCLLVTPPRVEETYLVDVGFGRTGLPEPIPLSSLGKGPLDLRGGCTVELRERTWGGKEKNVEVWIHQKLVANRKKSAEETEQNRSSLGLRRGFTFSPSSYYHFNDAVANNVLIHSFPASGFVKGPWVESRQDNCHVLLLKNELTVASLSSTSSLPSFSMATAFSLMKSSKDRNNFEKLQKVLWDTFGIELTAREVQRILYVCLEEKGSNEKYGDEKEAGRRDAEREKDERRWQRLMSLRQSMRHDERERDKKLGRNNSTRDGLRSSIANYGLPPSSSFMSGALFGTLLATSLMFMIFSLRKN